VAPGASKEGGAKQPDGPKPPPPPPPKPQPAKESKKEENPSPEPSLPASFGLKQFGKAAGADKPQIGDGAKNQTSHFAIPVLPSKKDKEALSGPPATEIRRLPSGRTPGSMGAPPKAAAGPQKEKEKPKEKLDPADRFRKKGQTLPASKAPDKATRTSPWPFLLDHKVIAAVVVGAVFILIDAVLSHHHQGSEASRPAKPPEIFQPVQPEKVPVSVVIANPAPSVPAAAPAPAPSPITVPPPPAPAVLPAPIAAPAPPVQNSWIFTGEAYDLITLKPIRGASLYFTSIGGGQPTVGTTDENGRFKMYLPPTPPGGGYQLTAKHPDYLDGYIDELASPLKEEDLERRRVLAASAVANQRWVGSMAAPTKRDFIMIPKVVPTDAQ
jgi:hypothetical protein